MIKCRKDRKDYIFSLDDGVLTVNGKKIPCRVKAGYSIQINKSSVSSDTGADGVYSFIKRAIKENFMMCYVWRIIEIFA